MEHPATRVDWVARRLRDAIMTGELESGAKVSAQKVAQEWGISPTPLREALQRLASEGLIEATPQRGARVSETTPAKAKELYEMRLLLEPLALQDSLSRFTDEDRLLVAERFSDYAKLWEDPSPVTAEMAESHKRFHDATLRRCSSTRLADLVSELTAHSLRYTAWLEARDRVEEHERIYQAIEDGDVQGAAIAVSDHLQPGLRWALEHLQEEGKPTKLIVGLAELIGTERTGLGRQED